MSEKLYALLLRLYPAEFRKEYGEPALQLFRDRAHAERGFSARIRLWLDLVADLVISSPREYRDSHSVLTVSHIQLRTNGMPWFPIIEDGMPSAFALIAGGFLTSISIATFWIATSHSVYRPVPGSSTLPTPTAQMRPTDQPGSKAVSVSGAGVGQGSNFDSEQRQRIIALLIDSLKQNYADSEASEKIAAALLTHENSGDNDAANSGAAFAALLAIQMRQASGDLHFDVIYRAQPFQENPPPATPEAAARFREIMKQQNCTFEKVQVLPDNIGYLKFDFFPDRSVCGAIAKGAMETLNNTDAIIFDLRDNRGGEPDMVQFMASYLFDHPEYFFNPRENTSRNSWTQSPVPGNKLADKPAFVLISHTTGSGAEQFCYNLKMLKRATLVGETTAGQAHSGVLHRLNEHFAVIIPEAKPINPYATADWEQIGVAPDVKVSAAYAVEMAVKLAEQRLPKK